MCIVSIKEKLFYDLYKRIAYEVHFTYATDKKKEDNKENKYCNQLYVWNYF